MGEATLDESAVQRLFPLHFELDAELRFSRVSARLSALVPEAVAGALLDEALVLVRPRTAPTFENFALMSNVSCVFRTRAEGGLVLRGQVVSPGRADRLLFVVGPQVTDTAQLAQSGLKLTDFPPHDARLDLLVMVAGKEAALKDAERMAVQLRELHARASERAHQLETEIVRQERVASLGRVVAGVAHEINTPLGVAVTAASLVSEAVRHVDELVKSGRLKRSDLDRLVTEAGEALEVLQVNVRRAAELVHQFKDVAVDQAGSGVRQIELGAYVEESLVALRPLLKGSRVVVRVERTEPVEIETRPGVISQLVNNFVQNALTHAFEPGQAGHVVLRVGREGDQALLVVSDDGAGMPPEVAAHAFEPFFTTRRGRGGSGLGLFVVHNLVVDALRGQVELESEQGRGTTFRVRIPLDLSAGEPGGFMPHTG